MIPVFRFDEHNEAFYYWQKARHEGLIADPVDLFHVDAHSDMDRPRRFKNSIYYNGDSSGDADTYYRRFVREDLKINDFIIPAVLVGLVRNVYFLYPHWRKFKTGRTRMKVASVFGEGRHLKYPYKPGEKGTEHLAQMALPDLKTFSYIAYPIEKIPLRKKAIMDIDLDYFACRDTVFNTYQYELEISVEQYRDRRLFMKNPTLQFAGLVFKFKKHKNRHLVAISFKKTADKAHLPDKKDIETEVDQFVAALQGRKCRPQMITICRSGISGYCPPQYGKHIEKCLIEKLKAVYPLDIRN